MFLLAPSFCAAACVTRVLAPHGHRDGVSQGFFPSPPFRSLHPFLPLPPVLFRSWGEYWGELGFFRIARGRNTVGVEQNCAWVTPGGWTEANVPCFEDGTNCGPGGAGGGVGRAHYADPGRARVPAGRLAAERRGGGGGAVAGKKVGATTLLVMAEGEQKEAEAALGVDDGSVL